MRTFSVAPARGLILFGCPGAPARWVRQLFRGVHGGVQMASEIDHDMERWGAPCTDEVVPRPVIRLANVVKERMTRDGVPVKVAAERVIDEVRAGGVAEFFLFRRGYVVLNAIESDQWRPPAAHFNWPVTRTYEDPWKFRGVFCEPHDHSQVKWGWPGIDGMISCLHDCWVMQAQRRDDLDKDLAARVAILKTDAQRLFGFDDAAAVHQLRPVLRVVPEAPVPKPPAGMEHDGASLLRRQNELKAAHHKSPTKQLVEETGLHEKDIQRRMKAHRPTSAPQPCLDNVWGGSSKVHKAK